MRLLKQVIITGDKVADASVGYDESGFPQVNISLDGEGGTKMHRSTRNNVGRKMAVIFVERKIKTSNTSDEIESYFDKRIISLATIQSALANQFRITGLDSPNAASELALLLRAGALAAPMNFVEEGTVGPSLGADNIRVGVQSLMLGLSLVLIFMIFYYKVFGVIANIAVALNIVLISAIMSILSATLTLPGIAGIVLTIGMAVDANVLIFSRIKEELKNRLKPLDAINAGYDRAYITIVDANLTTLIVALILYTIGTGPVQGFAITLSVGILTSMFTAILVTRFLVWLIYRNRKISIHSGYKMQINFMRPRKIASALSILLVVLSIFSLSFKGLNAGLDFTGGTLIEIKLSQSTNLEEIREVLGSKLEDDFQVSYFGSEQDVLIKIPGGSENNLSDEIVAALKNSFQFDLRRKDFIGPQIGEELRDQGGLGILAAMLVMMVYIMFRFQFKFAIGALLALVHDVLIVLGFFSIFYIGFNLTVLAAILAVIGYSLNDTIVVSDRIRENYRKKRKSDNVDVINRSLNQMLGRTLITSLTTLLVLFALLILGGDFIQNFAIALICGVIVGTYSSIYVLCNNLILMNLNFEDLAIKKSETYDDGMP